MTLAFESATALAQKIRNKEMSARELTDYFIGRIERFDAAVNAVPVRDFERAQDAADLADRAQAEGRSLGPLHGVPLTIKEAYNIAGLPTTWGHPVFKDNLAGEDAEVVQRLKSAGAHFLGKTNVPVDLADFQSYNDVYGTTNNPWNTERTPGGSSGGSAAALAAGFCSLESGSDIGGSIRNPAHFCGVYGHKPTWGIVPPQGHALPGMLAPPDIAVVGPMARSAQDLALAMDIVAGADPLRAPGWKLELARPEKKSLSEYRVAIWPSDPRAPVSAEMAGRVRALGDQLRGLGATVSDTARPDIDLGTSWQAYMYMLCGVMAAGLPDDQFMELQDAAEGFAPDDMGFAATNARASVQHHRDWLRWNNVRETLRQAWRQFFNDWDILLCPQMATTAFPHDQSDIIGRRIMVDQEEQPYFQQLFWAGLITVGYLPSTVFPTGPGMDGLPIGLQAVSAEFNDYTCIHFAHLMELTNFEIELSEPEIDQRADGAALLHGGEAVIDFVQLDLIGDPIVQVQASLHIQIDQMRHVGAEPVRAHGRALNLALTQESIAIQLDLLAKGHHAHDGGRAANRQHFERLLGSFLQAQAFDGMIDAALGQFHDPLNRIAVVGIDQIGRAQLRRQSQFRRVGIDRKDPARAGHMGAIDGGHANATATDHRDRLTKAHGGGIDGGAEAGDDAAADQGGAVQGHLVLDLHDGVFMYQHLFGE